LSAEFDGRLTIIESIAKGLRSYSRKGAILQNQTIIAAVFARGYPDDSAEGV
jgi:hypothetical protein